MQNLLQRYWFLISLFVAIGVGFSLGPQLGGLESANVLRGGVIFCVMFCMALGVEFHTFLNVLKRPWAAMLGCLLNMAGLPMLFFCTSFWLNPELAAGFLVVGATPCTLATASVWTRKAGGNDAVSMFVTLVTNGTCFFVSPIVLWLTLGGSYEIELVPIILKLFYMVVIPIFLAQVARYHSTIATFASNQKTLLGVFAQAGILFIVVVGAVKTRELYEKGAADLSWLTILITILLSACVCSLALGFGFGLSRAIRFSRPDSIAVGISGSQKTLMIGLLLCLQVDVTIVPLVIYHTIQLIVGAVFATSVNQESATPRQNAS